MGRGRGQRRGPKHDGGRGGERNTNGSYSTFTDVGMVNERFEAYYKAQGVVPEAEWDEFMAILKTELPTTFRVTGSRAHAETISNMIKDTYVPTMQAVEHEGTTYGPPEEIPWYPGKLAWQLSAPKRIVRKSQPFKVFQRFLVGETEVGNLSRQEAVSMIPPLLLDVEPYHIAMDMCAAPGSKTAQILEAMNPHHTDSTGLLIANDSDYKRTHMLVHQTGRMPSKGLIVTNCDASLYPHLKAGPDSELRFDRILADVPCSGDGTLRKNAEIWHKWGAGDGNGLHGLQLRILKRAMDMLKPGGRLVYSTCSFNPVENEAVIAAALKQRKGFSIVDVSSYLPALKRRPGITKWKVAFNAPEGTKTEAQDAGMKWYDSYAAYQADPLPDRAQTKDPWKMVLESLWAPEGIEGMGLEKSLRLLPHDQNTGGFYVCVLQKADNATTTSSTHTSTPTAGSAGTKRALSPSAEERDASAAKKERPSTPAEDASSTSTPAAVSAPAVPNAGTDKDDKKKKQDWSYREDPFSYAPESDPELQSIVKYFKLKESFPRDTILVRNEEGRVVRVAYFTNELVKSVLTNNDVAKMRLIFAGVKGFVRQDAQNRTDIPCKWRIPSEGLPEVLPHLGDGVVREMGEYGMETLRILVEHPYPALNKFPQQVQEWFADAPPASASTESGEGGEGSNEGKLGNIIASFPAATGAGGKLPLGMVLPIWKAKTSLGLLIDKREKSTLSLRVFGEDICQTVPTKKDQERAGPGQKGGKAEQEQEQEEQEEVQEAVEEEGTEDKQAGEMEVDEEEGLNAPAVAVGQAEEAATAL